MYESDCEKAGTLSKVPNAAQKTAVQARRDSVLADMTHTPLMGVSPDEVPLMQSPCSKKVPTPVLAGCELRWG
jgi:hypothetical protein